MGSIKHVHFDPMEVLEWHEMWPEGGLIFQKTMSFDLFYHIPSEVLARIQHMQTEDCRLFPVMTNTLLHPT